MRMSVRSGLLIAIGGMLLCVPATRASAQSPEIRDRVYQEMRVAVLSTPPNENGFTLRNLFDKDLWIGIAHPLQVGGLSEIAGNVHRIPRPGVQFELLTPGFAGITMHFRW